MRSAGFNKIRLISALPSGFIIEGYFAKAQAGQFTKAPVPSLALINQLWLEEPEFNPLQHLNMQIPPCHNYSFPEESDCQVFGSDFKFTSPFQVLSTEGLRVVNEIMDRNMAYVRTGRQHACIRGLGYRSRFISDLNHCTLLNEYFSDIMGFKLQPHPIA